MSIISVAVKYLIAAGVTGDALVTAIAEMEEAQNPIKSKGAIRQQRYLEKKKASKASFVTLCDDNDEKASQMTLQQLPLDAPFTLSPHPLPLSPLNPPQSKKPNARKPKITLEELSTDHIADWLSKKRTQGRYVRHDEFFILEYFKNYCQSSGKNYENFIAAYRNAFEWDSCQPKGNIGGIGKSEWTTAAEQIIAEDRANARQRTGQGTIHNGPESGLHSIETIR